MQRPGFPKKFFAFDQVCSFPKWVLMMVWQSMATWYASIVSNGGVGGAGGGWRWKWEESMLTTNSFMPCRRVLFCEAGDVEVGQSKQVLEVSLFPPGHLYLIKRFMESENGLVQKAMTIQCWLPGSHQVSS